jgi:hypothetical protein
MGVRELSANKRGYTRARRGKLNPSRLLGTNLESQSPMSHHVPHVAMFQSSSLLVRPAPRVLVIAQTPSVARLQDTTPPHGKARCRYYRTGLRQGLTHSLTDSIHTPHSTLDPSETGQASKALVAPH